MHITLKAFAVLSLTAGLAACGGEEESGYGGHVNEYEPQGYYSNASHGDDDRHDGPMTEWYDHSVGQEAKNLREEKERYLHVEEGEHPQNPSKPLTYEDHGFLERDNKHPHSNDVNYHGNRGMSDIQAKNSYYTNYNGKLAETVAKKAEAVEGVKAARAFISKKEMVVAAQLRKESNPEAVRKEVRRLVKDYADGRELKVTTDNGTFNYIRNLDNSLRDGGPIDLEDTRFSRERSL
ncbi:YhcN/YlaJ family sporulation lipoprotein [Bacillus thermotolerans]|uniref:Spore cortex protein CoxA n=1 Tax=Bacillus thermotolerans TaxID=1221996 RepID=A0A0F5HMR3_BACTR|nr:YhcN/YlaJ family sporulation lipoprotein [Bacillus thermotolerans]KKB34543.1 hypothetical protein QY97_02271 [Bacillus thermotolerans]KKB43427.1 hypothetical protein QY95_01672 [Bacillus thermotolerans]KKB43452.1 hypothetical protein QY96_00850 [Bacillus thermotolerans]